MFPSRIVQESMHCQMRGNHDLINLNVFLFFSWNWRLTGITKGFFFQVCSFSGSSITKLNKVNVKTIHFDHKRLTSSTCELQYYHLVLQRSWLVVDNVSDFSVLQLQVSWVPVHDMQKELQASVVLFLSRQWFLLVEVFWREMLVPCLLNLLDLFSVLKKDLEEIPMQLKLLMLPTCVPGWWVLQGMGMIGTTVVVVPSFVLWRYWTGGFPSRSLIGSLVIHNAGAAQTTRFAKLTGTFEITIGKIPGGSDSNEKCFGLCPCCTSAFWSSSESLRLDIARNCSNQCGNTVR